MIGHVKLEIAIQIAAEEIADIYSKIDKCNSLSEKKLLHNQLKMAFVEKEQISLGNKIAIEKILIRRRRENG